MTWNCLIQYKALSLIFPNEASRFGLTCEEEKRSGSEHSDFREYLRTFLFIEVRRRHSWLAYQVLVCSFFLLPWEYPTQHRTVSVEFFCTFYEWGTAQGLHPDGLNGDLAVIQR